MRLAAPGRSWSRSRGGREIKERPPVRLGDSAGVGHAALGGCRRSEAGVRRWIMRPRKQAIGRWSRTPLVAGSRAPTTASRTGCVPTQPACQSTRLARNLVRAGRACRSWSQSVWCSGLWIGLNPNARLER